MNSEQIWLVEVGENGWSRLCQTQDERIQAIMDRQDELRQNGVHDEKLRVTISLNGEITEQFFVYS